MILFLYSLWLDLLVTINFTFLNMNSPTKWHKICFKLDNNIFTDEKYDDDFDDDEDEEEKKDEEKGKVFIWWKNRKSFSIFFMAISVTELHISKQLLDHLLHWFYRLIDECTQYYWPNVISVYFCWPLITSIVSVELESRFLHTYLLLF